MARQPSPTATLCPCGSGRSYLRCCQPCHEGQPAASAEALMRSRYSAFVLELHGYLLQSWHPEQRPQLAELQQQEKVKWLGLTICHQQQDEQQAWVEFIARYSVNGRAYRLHETSRFLHNNGHWYYHSGEIHSS